MPTRRRSRLWFLVLGLAAVLVLGGWASVLLERASRQRQAVQALRALGVVVTYDYELDPSYRTAETHREFMAACKDVTDRREFRDPDHDGRAWLRRLIGPDFFCDVVNVNAAYSYGSDGKDRQEPVKAFHENLTLVKRFPELRLLSLIGAPADDRVLEAIRDLRELRAIYMWNANVTDEGVKNLRGLKEMLYIHLSNSAVTDATLEVLGALRELEGLSLQGNRFTDEGLVHLRNLTKLRSLWLCSVGDKGDSRIVGPGLAHLAALEDLEELALQDTHFGDAGVEHLRAFKRLKKFYLNKCDLTADGEARLREILPNLEVDIQRR